MCDGAPDATLASLGEREKWRSASVIKPLLFWAAAGDYTPYEWIALAEPAVVVSANDPTRELWHVVGGGELVERINRRCSTRMEIDPTRQTFGGVLLDCGDLAKGYMAMAMASRNSAAPARLIEWMRMTEQDLGVTDAVAEALGVGPERVAIKAGWFCDEDHETLRTHLVAMDVSDEHVRGAAVMTRVPYEDAASYLDAYEAGTEVLSIHERLVSGAIRDTLVSAIGALGDA